MDVIKIGDIVVVLIDYKVGQQERTFRLVTEDAPKEEHLLHCSPVSPLHQAAIGKCLGDEISYIVENEKNNQKIPMAGQIVEVNGIRLPKDKIKTFIKKEN